MEEADVVVTATNSNHPVYSHSLHPGVHLNAVGSFKTKYAGITIRVYVSS